MNSRERVLRAIKFERPDRVPVIHTHLSGALLKYGKRLLALYRKYPNDFYDIIDEVIKIPEREKTFYKPNGSFYKEEKDEWGVVWAFYNEGIAGQVIKAPLEDWQNFKDYKFPEPLFETDRKKKSHKMYLNMMTKKGYPTWGGGGSLFQQLTFLRGFDNLLIDIIDKRPEFFTLLDRLMEEYLIPSIENNFKFGVNIDIIGFADDWGTQTQLMINPELWREIFKPRYQKLFSLCHAKGALTYLHSDGMILDIIPDLIDIGLDVINPQFSCMDLKRLRELTDHKLCISSDIDRQSVLPFGTPQEVRHYVKKIFDLFVNKDGGFIARGEVGPDVPLENVEAMLKAFYDFG